MSKDNINRRVVVDVVVTGQSQSLVVLC